MGTCMLWNLSTCISWDMLPMIVCFPTYTTQNAKRFSVRVTFDLTSVIPRTRRCSPASFRLKNSFVVVWLNTGQFSGSPSYNDETAECSPARWCLVLAGETEVWC